MAPLTTSATGDRRRRAFTLTEVLVVIALLGLVTALVTMDFDMVTERARTESAQETLARALIEARAAALRSGGPAALRFDAEAGELRLLAGGEATRYPMPAGWSVRFALPDEDEGAAGERAVETLAFHATGCTAPAVLVLSRAGEATRYRVEPFSAALAEEAPR